MGDAADGVRGFAGHSCPGRVEDPGAGLLWCRATAGGPWLGPVVGSAEVPQHDGVAFDQQTFGVGVDGDEWELLRSSGCVEWQEAGSQVRVHPAVAERDECNREVAYHRHAAE